MKRKEGEKDGVNDENFTNPFQGVFGGENNDILVESLKSFSSGKISLMLGDG